MSSVGIVCPSAWCQLSILPPSLPPAPRAADRERGERPGCSAGMRGTRARSTRTLVRRAGADHFAAKLLLS